MYTLDFFSSFFLLLLLLLLEATRLISYWVKPETYLTNKCYVCLGLNVRTYFIVIQLQSD